MELAIPLLAVVLTIALGLKTAWPVAAGFLIGSAIAYLNFRWLKATVIALTDAVTTHAAKPSVVFRFLTRFVLITVAAYVIFVSYPIAFHGFLAGLFVPVLAILLEAVYVLYQAIQQGI